MKTLRAYLKLLLFLPIAAILVLFSVANRAPVALSFDPFSRGAPLIVYQIPLYLIVLGAIGVGILVGGFAAWLMQGKHRKAERFHKREAQQLRREAERLRESAPLATLPAPRG